MMDVMVLEPLLEEEEVEEHLDPEPTSGRRSAGRRLNVLLIRCLSLLWAVAIFAYVMICGVEC